MKPIPDQISITKEESVWTIRLIFNDKREPHLLRVVSDPAEVAGIIKQVLKGSYS